MTNPWPFDCVKSWHAGRILGAGYSEEPIEPMRFQPSAEAGRTGSRAQLTVAVARAAVGQHLRSQRGNARDADQDPVHEDRFQQRRDPPRIMERESDDGIGEPADPFEEIVGMARPAPESGIADLAPVGGISAETLELRIGQRSAADSDCPDRRTEIVLEPQQPDRDRNRNQPLPKIRRAACDRPQCAGSAAIYVSIMWNPRSSARHELESR